MQPDSGQTARGMQAAKPYEMSRIDTAGQGAAAAGAGLERAAQGFVAGRAQALQQQLQIRELQANEARNAAHIQVQQLQAMEMQQRMQLLGSEEQLYLLRAQRKQADAAASLAEAQAKKFTAEAEGRSDGSWVIPYMIDEMAGIGKKFDYSTSQFVDMTPEELSRRDNSKAAGNRAQLGRGLISDASDQLEAMLANPSAAAQADAPRLRAQIQQLTRAIETGGSLADVLGNGQQAQLPPAPVTKYQPSEADFETAWKEVGDTAAPLAGIPRGMVNGYVMQLLQANGQTPADAADLAVTFKDASNRLVERLRRDPAYLQRIYGPSAPVVRIAAPRVTRAPSHSDATTLESVRAQIEAEREAARQRFEQDTSALERRGDPTDPERRRMLPKEEK